MRNFKTETGRRYCRCGALTEATKTLCNKCRSRARWYRRKAWRANPLRHINQSPQERSDAT
jgi:hypothetical protein